MIEYIEIDGLMYPKIIPNYDETEFGKYGRMRLRYLKKYNEELLFRLLVENRLIDYLIDINDRTYQMIDDLEKAYFKRYPLPHGNFIETAKRRNQARAYAEEFALNEIIYA